MKHKAAASAFVFAAGLVFGCGEQMAPPTEMNAVPPRLGVGGFTCDVTATFETVVVDDEMVSEFGAGAYVDTVRACFGWTGTDYRMEVSTLGTSQDTAVAEEVDIVQYRDGAVAGYASDGTELAAPEAVGGTSFEYVQADQTQIDASYADPYYALVNGGGGGGGGGDDPPMEMGAELGGTDQATSANTGTTGMSLTRRAARALVAGTQELPPTLEGWRRFRRVQGNRATVFDIDPQNELIRAVNISDPEQVVKTKINWRQYRGKWVRDVVEQEHRSNRNGIEGPVFRTTTKTLAITWSDAAIR